MTRRISKLSNLEIDEVSTVDRPANQHGLIAFSKAQEDRMVYDADGNPVDENDLQHGDVVYDEDGTELAYLEEDGDDDGDDDEVGKANLPGARDLADYWQHNLRRRGARAVDNATRTVRAGIDNRPGAREIAGRAKRRTLEVGFDARNAGRRARTRAGMQYRYMPTTAALGTGAVAGGGGVYALDGRHKVGKSLGDSVLEELSKAVTDADREQIIAKALDEVEIFKAENEDLRKAFEEEQDLRIEQEFIAKADEEYNLPIDPRVFGPVLKRLCESPTLTDEDLEVLDTVFKSAGEMIFDEIGVVGGGQANSVLDHVDAVAQELIAKSDGQFTAEQAIEALFDQNPDAYDAYLQER